MSILASFFEHKAAQAPMAGVTDWAFRETERKFSNALLFSEMLSAHSLVHAHERTLKMSGVGRNEPPIAMQLYGADPAVMAQAAKILQNEANVAFIDINMGCPVRKITSAGAGGALMKTPDIAAKIIDSVVQSVTCPVTFKCRLGQNGEQKNYLSFCAQMKQAGASGVFLHARTVEQGYAGKADWNAVAALKSSIDFFIVGNGDVFSSENAKEFLEKTRCDGVLIGRGLLGKPWFLAECNAFLESGRKSPFFQNEKCHEIVLEHFDYLEEYYGTRNAVFVARKHLAWYSAGKNGAVEFRKRLFSLTNAQQVRAAIKEFFG